MSASHDDVHGHAPEPAEVSSPLLWTICLLAACIALGWWFFHWLGDGRIEGRRSEPVPRAAGAVRAVEPDHKKLIADRSPDVINQGALLYAKNCASCHGAEGGSNPSNMNPPPRNFHTDSFKNPLGAGPYGFYSVLTHGYNGMPAFPGLAPAQRYAIAHFVRETWMKTDNAKNYLEQDPDAVAKQIPPPGQAMQEGPEVRRDQIEIKAPVRPLLSAIAAEQEQAGQRREARLDAARRAAGRSAVSTSVQELLELSRREGALVDHVLEAARAGDRARFMALLAASDGSGAVRPYFSLLTEAQLLALFQFLTSQGAK